MIHEEVTRFRVVRFENGDHCLFWLSNTVLRPILNLPCIFWQDRIFVVQSDRAWNATVAQNGARLLFLES